MTDQNLSLGASFGIAAAHVGLALGINYIAKDYIPANYAEIISYGTMAAGVLLPTGIKILEHVRDTKNEIGHALSDTENTKLKALQIAGTVATAVGATPIAAIATGAALAFTGFWTGIGVLGGGAIGGVLGQGASNVAAIFTPAEAMQAVRPILENGGAIIGATAGGVGTVIALATRGIKDRFDGDAPAPSGP